MLDLNEFIIIYLIGSLFTFRVAFLLVFEEGLFGLGDKIRELAGVYIAEVEGKNPLGQPVMVKQAQSGNWIGKALCCFNCTSVWVGFCVALAIILAYPSATYWHGGFWFIAHSFAISGLALIWRGIAS